MDKNAIIQQLITNGQMQNDDEMSLFAQAIEDLIFEGIDSSLEVENSKWIYIPSCNRCYGTNDSYEFK